MNNDNGIRKSDSSRKTSSTPRSKEFTECKRKLRSICLSLSYPTDAYDAKITMKAIQGYIRNQNILNRVLYSEISGYIFGLDAQNRGTFITNAESLLQYVLYNNDDYAGDGVIDIIVRIYDHSLLAIHQIENADNTFRNSISDTKEMLQKQIKGIEKEYITILGIFAAIVLAFVGGITFSSSVLQSIAETNIYRLLLITDILAFTIVNLIYLLIKFIYTINEKDSKMFNIARFNIAFAAIAVIIVAAWFLDLPSLQSALFNLLPWNK